MSKQGNHLSYRVLVFGREGTEVLLRRSVTCVQFPEVTIPQCERVAENVASAMKQHWGEIVVCLFEPDTLLSARSSRCIVVRHWHTCGTMVKPLQWVSASELSPNLFACPDDYRALGESLAKCQISVSDAGIGRFARLSWFEELCEWIGNSIASRSLHLTGGFRQLNASPTFSLIRFETNGPAVWFKAVGQPNEREFSMTLKLTQLFPKYTSEIVAARDDWKGWLARETPGTNLAGTSDLSLWKTAAASLAKLQIESIGNWVPLLHAGAHEVTAVALLGTVAPFRETIAELMSQQSKTPPPVISKSELALLGDRIRDAISALQESEIADTLGHFDLNPGNIIVGVPDQCVFLDWAEAYVGHPFYSFQYLLQHFRRMRGEDPVAELTFTSSYLQPWSDFATVQSLAEAMALTPLIAAFAYGAGTDAWRKPEYLRDPKVAGYLRALARRMKREADQLSERSTPCLS
nr:hypothetical protein Hi04_10k_c5548_00010 [uncultured bacterium]